MVKSNTHSSSSGVYSGANLNRDHIEVVLIFSMWVSLWSKEGNEEKRKLKHLKCILESKVKDNWICRISPEGVFVASVKSDLFTEED